MICRETSVPVMGRAWQLIGQADHASVAEQLARNWALPLPVPEAYAAPYWSAIGRHDDGWKVVDASAEWQIDTGRPRDFLSMERRASNAIWSRSIEGVEDLGPLAQFMVAAHFLGLRRHGESPADELEDPFVSRFAPACSRWREQSGLGPSCHAAAAHLTFFDRFSLWLCCGLSPPDHELTWSNAVWKLSAVSPAEIAIRPWPFRAESVSIVTHAVTIPRRDFQSSENLRQAIATGIHEELRWSIHAHGQ